MKRAALWLPVAVVLIFALASYLYIKSQRGYVVFSPKTAAVVLTKGGKRTWYVTTAYGFPRIRFSDLREEQQKAASQ